MTASPLQMGKLLVYEGLHCKEFNQKKVAYAMQVRYACMLFASGAGGVMKKKQDSMWF